MAQNPNFFGEVYVHTCIPNGKSYVGQTTVGVSKRWALHQRCARSPKTSAYQNLFSKAIRKYGADAFDHKILGLAYSAEDLDCLEKAWILMLQTKQPNGYNLTDGGDSGTAGHEVSPAVREVLRTKATVQWQDPAFRVLYSELRRGKKMAPAASERRLAALRAVVCGKKQSAETIAKRVEKLKGKKRTQEFREQCAARMMGRKLPLSTRAAMSTAQLARQARKEKEPNVS